VDAEALAFRNRFALHVAEPDGELKGDYVIGAVYRLKGQLASA